MPMTLEGSCRCGGVTFSVESSGPYPYQLCYCSICRKTAGGGGYAINLIADARTLKTGGEVKPSVYRAEIAEDDGEVHASTGERNVCRRCATALWFYDPDYPDILHPFASAIDTDLPVPPQRTHLMLKYKASWVEPRIGPDDKTFDLYPTESIEDWHRARGLWIE